MSSRRRDNLPIGGVRGDPDGGGGETGDSVEELEAAEQQLEKLRRQHRMRERNRRQYRDEASTLLNRQRTILAKLSDEKAELTGHLEARQHEQSQRRERSASSALSNTIQRHHQYAEEIATAKDQIAALQASTAEAEKRLREQARGRPSLLLLRQERQGAQAANTTLLNRIQQATVRLNAVLADNAVLRTDIQGLLKERDKFLLQAERLERQIAAATKKKSDIMDEVTRAYTERDEAGGKIRAVRDRASRDSRSHGQELKKLQRILDHQTSLKSFVTTIAAGEEGGDRRGAPDGAEDRGGPAETLKQYRESMNKLLEAVKKIDLEEPEVWDPDDMSKVGRPPHDNMEDAAPKDRSRGLGIELGMGGDSEKNELPLQEGETGSDLADILLANFLQAENDNYTIFSYVSGVNNEASGINSDITRLRLEVEELQQKKNRDQLRALQTITQLQDRVEAGERAIEELTLEAAKAEDAITGLKGGALDLFGLLRCDLRPVHAITGGGEVTSSTLTVYLSVVEQRVAELLQQVQRSEGGALGPDESSNEISSAAVSPADVKTLQMLQRPSPPQGGAGCEDDTGSPLSHAALMDAMYRHMAPQAN